MSCSRTYRTKVQLLTAKSPDGGTSIHRNGLSRTMNMRLTILTLSLVLFGAACSTEDVSSSSLAILDSGGVVVVDSDGANRVVVAAATDEVFFQPIWSPDGTMIAFSRISPDPELHVARLDGTASFTIEADTVPFYFSWSNDGDLALLRSGETGLRLERTSITDDALVEPKLVATGQPLYYSWNPDGDDMATHIGADRLETTDGGGSAEIIGISPGMFQAPSWTDRGIIATEDGSRDHRLVLITPDGNSTALATLPGPTTFVATNEGNRIALQSIVADVEGLSASLQALPSIPTNRLVVADIDNGDFTPITDQPVIAFFWSPTGDQILILDVVDGPQTRWSIWSEAGLEEIVRFDPEPSFMSEMVPFFDQYAQSLSLWAPDGSAFAFPGSVDGEQGIWVAGIDGELDRISDGSWVSWSP